MKFESVSPLKSQEGVSTAASASQPLLLQPLNFSLLLTSRRHPSPWSLWETSSLSPTRTSAHPIFSSPHGCFLLQRQPLQKGMLLFFVFFADVSVNDGQAVVPP